MMTKKLTSLALALVMCLSLYIPAFALDNSPDSNPEVRVVNHSDSITAQELQEIVSSTSAYLTLKDGTAVPVDSVVTVEDIAAPDVSPNQNSYKVTLSATASSDKIVSDSAEKNGSVTASATLELIWVDGPELDNVIKKVSGTLNVVKGTVSEATVRYGIGWVSALQWTSKDVTGKTSFSYSPNLTVQCPKADYSIVFEEAMVAMSLSVSSSVFQ
ncbi:hypothetical protein OBV_19630 [Oscillibacter valericigenes Sjm18-20]|nr:hypothetical protein OBV_19630 [Oscillibacter valericigenes Sjm18-20]